MILLCRTDSLLFCTALALALAGDASPDLLESARSCSALPCDATDTESGVTMCEMCADTEWPSRCDKCRARCADHWCWSGFFKLPVELPKRTIPDMDAKLSFAMDEYGLPHQQDEMLDRVRRQFTELVKKHPTPTDKDKLGLTMGMTSAHERLEHPDFPKAKYLEHESRISDELDEGAFVEASKVEHLLEHGYVLEEGVFTAEDCDEMHAMMELLSNWNVAHTADRANDINVSRVHRVHHYVFTPTPTNVWSRVVQHKSILSLMHQVLRKPLLVAATTYNVYVGATSKNVQLHMDGTLNKVSPRPNTTVQITAVVYLDDADGTNGATTLVPRTHRMSTMTPTSPEARSLLANPRDPSLIQLPASKGSVLFIDATIFHRGSAYPGNPNLSEAAQRPRITLVLLYSDDIVHDTFSTFENMVQLSAWV